MKGIILAGGTGSRLYPLTKITNKHLLPVGRYPMIEYSIAKMKECGIKDIMIVFGKDNSSNIANFLGSGKSYGINITYKVQDKAGGIAEALGLCENFVNKDKCLVILGDNIFFDNIAEYTHSFEKEEKGAKILIKEVNDPKRYGIAEIKDGKIISIEEKPSKPKSNYCVTGIYMYDNRVFDVIKTLKPSARGETEITDVNNWYINDGTLSYDMLIDWWIDAGTFEALAKANELVNDLKLNYELWPNEEDMQE